MPTTPALPAGTPSRSLTTSSPSRRLPTEDHRRRRRARRGPERANQISDNFVLTAVLFASVLFFAGIAARFRPQWIRWAMLSVAVFVFVSGAIVEFVVAPERRDLTYTPS